ncbi:hypothetical protein BDV93DRAFT_528679 [Ceratobasidium sp. AG-I]|nr:hypothetical protein BDV93DRAFT_528679 [Ceratobasidium sp. AG-I]
MGRALDGATEESEVYCDPRCNMHRLDEPVSRRTRQRCINRIDLLHWKQAALERDGTPCAKSSPPYMLYD